MGFLQSIVGRWEGTCRTWFQPDKLEDESPISGEIKAIPGGPFVRHTYAGTIKGKRHTGEETIALNAIDQRYQVAWFDDFHMNSALMFSEGAATENGFSVTGRYSIGPGEPPWSWRTVFELHDNDQLTITAYNISPDGQEAKGIETVYRRIHE